MFPELAYHPIRISTESFGLGQARGPLKAKESSRRTPNCLTAGGTSSAAGEDVVNYPITRVEICFYDPGGFPDTHEIVTDDHGVAVRLVMEKYPPEMLRRLKYVTAKLQDGLIEAMRNSDQC